MTDSILLTIKNMLGPSADYDAFDEEIIVHINSTFMDLNQIGVGPEEGFMIEGKDDTWEDFIPEKNLVKLQAVKTYIYLKVKLIFDPPSSSAVMESYQRTIDKIEWRLNHAVDPGEEEI